MQDVAAMALDKMIAYFQGDARRINHALKVHGFARSIAAQEGLHGDGLVALEVAAVLHDIGIKVSEEKYRSAAGKYQELEGPPVARKLLAETGLAATLVERICHLIGHHHSYGAIDGLDFQILVEADFLVNAFEDNLDREALLAVRDKYFKTAAGTAYLGSLYLGSC